MRTLSDILYVIQTIERIAFILRARYPSVMSNDGLYCSGRILSALILHCHYGMTVASEPWYSHWLEYLSILTN